MKGATSIQERLWELRKDKGLNLEELSKLTGISKSALGSYEKEDFKELFSQYGKTKEQMGSLFFLLQRATEISLQIINENEKRIKRRILRAPLIHKIFLDEREKQGNRRKYDYEELERMLLMASM